MTLQRSIIPWHVFMDALAKQPRSDIKDWLQRWRFTNDGVFMIHEMMRRRYDFPVSGNSILNSDKEPKYLN